MIKLIIIEKFEPKLLNNPNTISDIKGNFKGSTPKALVAKNDKGLTPLACAIEMGGLSVFRFLLELYQHIESNSPNSKVLTKALALKDDSTLVEPPLVKAVRKDRFDIVIEMLALN